MRVFQHSGIRPYSSWLLASLGIMLVIALVLTWIPNLDEAAGRYIDESIVDTGLAYAAARAINAIISVIQSIEISISLGAGVAVNLGEALDPLNDLIERFSAFILYAFAALGIQKLALVASSSLLTKVIVSVVMVGAWLTWLVKGSLPNILKTFLVIMIFVRFAFAVEVGVSWALDKAYFNAQEQQALSTLDVAETKLREVQDEYMQAIEEHGVFRGAWTTARNLIGTQDQQSITELTIDAVVQLLVITLVRSILLPLGFIWLLYLTVRRVLSS